MYFFSPLLYNENGDKMIKRTETKQVKVGNVIIGGNNEVIIQSMTTTKTRNIEDTVRQINSLATAGAKIVRVAILNMDDAKAIQEIKKQVSVPIVADIHFSYEYALEVIKNGIDKVRINPGNIGSKDRIKKVVEACKDKNIPIRIGINSGSLEKQFKAQYGVTSKAMIESLKYHVSILEEFEFYDIIISLKSSSIKRAVEAYKMASELYNYPLHIGITEAGTKFSGTIKSSIGLGILLYEGIGNTIRVSLSTDPVEEVRVAKEMLSALDLYKKPKIVSCPTCGRLQYKMFGLVEKVEAFLETIEDDITVAVMGCAVNGPGEASAADIGIAGGKNEGLIFVGGEIKRKVKEEDMFEEIKKEILEYIKNAN